MVDVGQVCLECENFFIAVADREVMFKGTGLYHYSLQLWKSKEKIPLKKQMKVSSLKEAEKIDSVELLANSGWEVYKKVRIGRVSRKDKILIQWIKTNVTISVIHLFDTSNRLVAILQGGQTVKKMWEKVKEDAATYKYAEQGGDSFNGNFKNWWNSKYQLPWDSGSFNNSNTFIRNIVSSSGLNMFEMINSHPGAESPSKIPGTYSKKPWREGSKPPTKPK